MLAPENQCSLDERHPVRRVGDAERARDGVGEMPFECYSAGHPVARRGKIAQPRVNSGKPRGYDSAIPGSHLP